MRLLQIIVVLFGISFITFGLTYMSPGDPVRNMYSANGVMRLRRCRADKRRDGIK